MGVDYYPCTACGETFPDCGNYYTCLSYSDDSPYQELGGCERMFCGKRCAKPDGEGETISCVHCRCELDSDENLLGFLLARHGQTREEAAAQYVAEAKAKRAAAQVSSPAQEKKT
jgi:hypothetical protein